MDLLLLWFVNIYRVALLLGLHAALLPVHGGTLVHGHSFGVFFSKYPEVSMGHSDYQKSLILCKVLTGKNCSEVKDEGLEIFWSTVIEDVDHIFPKYVINFT